MKIKHKISIFMFLAVLLPFSISIYETVNFFENHEEIAEENYLTAVMAYADGLLERRMQSGLRVGQHYVKEEQHIQSVISRNRRDLNKLGVSICSELSYMDCCLFTDITGALLGTNNEDILPWPKGRLRELIDRVENTEVAISSYETLDVSDIVKINSRTYSLFRVALADGSDYLDKILAGVHVIPIFSGGTRGNYVGSVVLLDVINNEKTFTNSFAKRIKEAFISLSVDGIRVATNIRSGAIDNYVGSHIPVTFDITKVKKDARYGKQEFLQENDTHLFIDKELLNCDRQSVGVIGIGIPRLKFQEIFASSQDTLLLLNIALLFAVTLLGYYFFGSISMSIERITQSVKNFGRMELDSFDVNYSGDSDEIQVLTATFRGLINKLGEKEKETKKYILQLVHEQQKSQELADEVQKVNEHLEYMVEERTEGLTMALHDLRLADNAKSVFLANVSHELRTPLNFIIGASQMLNEEVLGKLTEKQRTYINNIHDSGEHLLLLINDILDVTKLSTGKMPLSLGNVVMRDVIEGGINTVMKMADEKHIKITWKITPENLNVYADQHKLLQIVYNLLSNAVKFTHEGGNVDVEVVKQENSFRMSVKDDGIGIAEENYEKVFVDFEQVDNPYTKQYVGTGLGLSIVKKLVALQGGEIVLKSEINIGTEFIVTLPLEVQQIG